MREKVVRSAYEKITGPVCFKVPGAIPLCAIVKCWCVVTGGCVGHRICPQGGCEVVGVKVVALMEQDAGGVVRWQ